MNRPLLMSRAEAARFLGMSLSHFQRHVQAEMPAIKSGQLRLYRQLELEDWIDREIDRRGRHRWSNRVRFTEAHDRFIADCKAGVALTKLGRPYKPKAISSLDSCLRRLPNGIRLVSLDALSRGELQEAVDDLLREGLSSSRIGAVINAVRSLYRWAINREMALDNPASLIQLPANDGSGEHRIATPGEFAHLLDQLAPEDALPWALAGYGSARAQEIEHLDWPEVDFDNDVLLLAADEEAKKSEAARRIVPMVRQLRDRLHAEWIRQGEPASGRVCPPRRADNKSGCISLNALQKRRFPLWEDLDLEPIGLHDSRHTCATWLDHA